MSSMNPAAFLGTLAFVFLVLPVLLVLGLKLAARAIVVSPDYARAFGWNMSPTAARLGVILAILTPFAFVQPNLVLGFASLATVILPIIIVTRLALGIATGLGQRHEEGFGSGFWRFADPVPLLCAVLVIAIVPVTLMRASQAEQRAAAASRAH